MFQYVSNVFKVLDNDKTDLNGLKRVQTDAPSPPDLRGTPVGACGGKWRTALQDHCRISWTASQPASQPSGQLDNQTASQPANPFDCNARPMQSPRHSKQLQNIYILIGVGAGIISKCSHASTGVKSS